MARNKLAAAARAHASADTSGFTLIEVLMVITLTVIVMVSATSLIFSALISNTKKDTIATVKQEGDYAISQMEFLIRNSIGIVANPNIANSTPQCTLGMKSLTVKALDNGITTFSIVNGQIASQSGVTAPIYLTSPGVTIGAAPNDLTFNCQQAVTNNAAYVGVSFTLSKQSPDFNHPNTTTEQFETGVNIRSF